MKTVDVESNTASYVRNRMGFAVLALGLFILLSAWVIAVNRAPLNATAPGERAVPTQRLDPPERHRILPAVSMAMLIWGIVILLIFVVSALAFLRMSRNYRRLLLRKTPPPTSATDVWKMHKTPSIKGVNGDDADDSAREDA